MRTLAIIALAFALSGCALLAGEKYVMSYSVSGETDHRMDEQTIGVSATVSGR